MDGEARPIAQPAAEQAADESSHSALPAELRAAVQPTAAILFAPITHDAIERLCLGIMRDMDPAASISATARAGYELARLIGRMAPAEAIVPAPLRRRPLLSVVR